MLLCLILLIVSILSESLHLRYQLTLLRLARSDGNWHEFDPIHEICISWCPQNHSTFGEELQFKNAVILVQSDAQKIEIFSIHSFPNILKELISTLKRMIKTFEPQDISIVGLFPSLF